MLKISYRQKKWGRTQKNEEVKVKRKGGIYAVKKEPKDIREEEKKEEIKGQSREAGTYRKA
jgi:hypothetical protein